MRAPAIVARAGAFLVVAVAAASVPARAFAQRAPDAAGIGRLASEPAGEAIVVVTARRAPLLPASSSWWVPATSVVLPGTGQALLRQNRWVAYAAVEAYTLAKYASDAREGRRQRDGYRALARRVARAPFDGPKPDGDFDYYERMEHFARSGAYDLGSAATGLTPEVDTTTSNGALWLLARQTYWENPSVPPPPGSEQYLTAIAFYTRRAIRPAYLWSWAEAPLEHDVFRTGIVRSNAAFRRSVEDLGAVLANHVLSTVDAYVTVRLRRGSSASGGYELGANVPFGGPARP